MSATLSLELLGANDTDLLREWNEDDGMRSVYGNADWSTDVLTTSWISSRKAIPAFDYIVVKPGVGAIGLTSLRTLRGPDIGLLSYAVAERYRGRGLGTRAVSQTVDLARGHHQFRLLWAVAETSTRPSCRLLERVGFKSTSPPASRRDEPEEDTGYVYYQLGI